MKVAVTGGAGQLGTLVLRKLAADRKITAIRSLDVRLPIVANKKVEAVLADVRDPDFSKHLEGCDALIHLAFIVTSWAPRETMDAVNVEGSKNVFRAAVAAGITTIVYASSVAAYGILGHKERISEDTPRREQAELAYAANKFAVEAFLDTFEAEHPLVAISRLRPVVLLGARMEHALGRAFNARVLPDLGGPPLPYVWDEDVAQAAVLCLKKQARGAFNLAAEGGASTEDLARAAGFRCVRLPPSAFHAFGQALSLFIKLGGRPSVDPTWLTLHPDALEYSSDKARRELGWSPKYPTAIELFRHVGEVTRGMTDPRIDLFFRLTSLAAKRMPPRPDRHTTSIHLELTGRGGADYTLRTDAGKLALEKGIPRPPSSVVSLRASVFRELLSGRLSPVTAEMTGKFRVEGDPLGGMVLAGIISLFRSQIDAPGPKGFTVRSLAAWLSRP